MASAPSSSMAFGTSCSPRMISGATSSFATNSSDNPWQTSTQPNASKPLIPSGPPSTVPPTVKAYSNSPPPSSPPNRFVVPQPNIAGPPDRPTVQPFDPPLFRSGQSYLVRTLPVSVTSYTQLRSIVDAQPSQPARQETHGTHAHSWHYSKMSLPTKAPKSRAPTPSSPPHSVSPPRYRLILKSNSSVYFLSGLAILGLSSAALLKSFCAPLKSPRACFTLPRLNQASAWAGFNAMALS